MIPSTKQWKRWSLPSKLTAIGTLVGILSFGTYLLEKGFGVSVDVNVVVETLENSHKDQLAKLEEKYQGELEDWKQQARQAVEALVNIRNKPDAPPRREVDRALALLEKGDAKAAEAIFQAVEQRKAAEGQAAHKEAAEAARHLGALAYLHDTDKALKAYRRATELDPTNPQGWNQLGHLLHRTGNLNQAEVALQKVLSLGESSDDSTWPAAAYGNLGIVHLTRGDLDEAIAMHEKALAQFQEIGAARQIDHVQGLIDSLR